MLGNELEGPSGTAGRETFEHIEIALRHTHLPKLADAGIITFAQDRQSVALDGMNGHDEFIDEAARIDGYAPSAAGD
jgi:phosphopentomutase